MKRTLTRDVTTYHYANDLRVDGPPPGVWGDLRGVRGDLSDVRGDLSDVRGDLSDVRGINIEDLRGQHD